jgi:preprotein translocase subunit YajC
MAIVTLEENPSYVLDDSIGIVIPKAILGEGRWYPHPFDSVNAGFVRSQSVLSFDKKLGVFLGHDPATGIAFWPAYASGFDDMLMRAMVQGYMANVGQTPVPITLLSTIVTKIQSMVGTWIMTLRGKTSPVKKTLDLMARAQDSQFGSANFVRLYMGALLVENRGAMGAQVPIESIPFDSWGEYNMVAQPIGGSENENLFVLTMTDEAFRENQGLWMVDGLTCFPTGNSEYPYWFRTWSEEAKRDMWVLIHRDYGWQMLNEAGGQNTLYPGFGQSGAWRFSPYAVKHMAIDRQDWEHIINQPARGIVWVSGLDYPTQFRDQMQAYEEDREEQEMYFYPGVFFGGSRGESSEIKMIPWSEPPAGYTADGWRKEWVDNLAAAYHLNVTHLEVRLGEGAMTQSDIASSLEAETAVAAMKEHIEALFNYVAPPRVMITVVWQTDRLKRYQVETFRELSLGISRVQDSDTGAMPPQLAPSTNGEEDEDDEPAAAPIPEPAEKTFTRDEIRGLFEEYIGIEIPDVGEGDSVEPDKKTGEDVEEGIWSRGHRGMTLGAFCAEYYDNDLDDMIEELRPGMIVETSTGMMGRIRRWSGLSNWIWIENQYGNLMLTDINYLYSLKEFSTELKEIARDILRTIEKKDHGDMAFIAEYDFKPGDRAKTVDGTPCTIVEVTKDAVSVKFDWDGPSINPKILNKRDLQPSGFKPEGEPLPIADSVDLNPEEAIDDARDSWEDYADEDVEDLI